MGRLVEAALADLAAEQRLGECARAYRTERPLVRKLGRFVWMLGFGGGVVGIALARMDPADSVLEGAFPWLVLAYVAGFAVAGPAAAVLIDPPGGVRWIVRYEHGLIEVAASQLETDVPAGRVIRFDQIGGVLDRSEAMIWGRPSSGWGPAGWMTVPAGYALYGVDGRRLLALDGLRPRAQRDLAEAVRVQVLPRLVDAAMAELARRGEVPFGELTVTRHGLVTTGSALVPQRLPWSKLARVERAANGAVVVYRPARPGQRAHRRDGTTIWFHQVVPNAAVAMAMIAALRAAAAPA